MDPISAILLLGAGAAVVAGARQDLSAVSRTQMLQRRLGMATQPPAPPATPDEEELPDRAPMHWSDVSLWEVFSYRGMHINLALNNLKWVDNQADLDEVIRHTRYRDKGLGYWQVHGEEASSEPRSLWRLMHLAWLGRMPTLTIDVSHNVNGRGSAGDIVVSYGFIETDVRILGDKVNNVTSHMMESWLDVDDQEIGGEAFVECAEIQIYDQLTVWGHYLVLGHLDESIDEDSFSRAMAKLTKKMSDLDSEVRTTESEMTWKMNEIATGCTNVAIEEVEVYRRTYELEHGDEDDEDDWDDDEDDWDDEDDEDDWEEED